MFVGQFGGYTVNDWHTTGPNTGFQNPLINYLSPSLGWRGTAPQLVGWAQNCGKSQLVTVNGNQYLIINSESGENPVHIWQLGNLSSIHEMTSPPAALGSSVTVSTVADAGERERKKAKKTTIVIKR
jgi:hypothetical protein